jgi:hypothetical protein
MIRGPISMNVVISYAGGEDDFRIGKSSVGGGKRSSNAGNCCVQLQCSTRIVKHATLL